MNRKETAKIMSIVKAAYPRYYADADMKSALELWSVMLADYDYSVITAAVKMVIATSKFPPTVADVIEKVQLLTEPKQLGEAEAWGLIKKAVSNGYYNSEEEFEKLPPILQEIVYSPSQIKAWGAMPEDEFNTVVASNVQRAYRAKLQNKKQYDLLPEIAKTFIENIKLEKLEEENAEDK